MVLSNNRDGSELVSDLRDLRYEHDGVHGGIMVYESKALEADLLEQC